MTGSDAGWRRSVTVRAATKPFIMLLSRCGTASARCGAARTCLVGAWETWACEGRGSSARSASEGPCAWESCSCNAAICGSAGAGATACVPGGGSSSAGAASTCGSTIGATATGATGAAGSTGATGATGAACNSDCCQWIGVASRDGAKLRSTVRLQYQKTNAAISSTTTINNRTTGTSIPRGRTICLASWRFSMVRGTTARSLAVVAGKSADAGIGIGIGTGRAALGAFATLGGGLPSGASAETFAAVRIPLNLPAHPRQYRARSLFAVWHDSQNFVIAITTRAGTHGIDMDAVSTTSKLITTEKAAKSITDARSGIPSECQGSNVASRTRRRSMPSSVDA